MNHQTTEKYIGLLSGTSIDSIDAAVFEIANDKINIIEQLSYPIDQKLKDNLNQLIIDNNTSLENLGIANKKLGYVFANSVLELLKKSNLSNNNITAIGFHGQTIFHQPVPPNNFSMQIGDPNTITELTNIPVITDFRQRDMVNGGQGAPLAPLFHKQFFSDNYINRAIVNIGGISNITLLECNKNNTDNKHYIASDLGPGNTLLDLWYRKNHPNSEYIYDKDGLFAKSGNINQELFELLLKDSYFSKPWPKSTGREYFNLNWLENYLNKFNKIKSEDIQRTLLELTAYLISNSIKNNHQHIDISEVLLCGGGANNSFLVERIIELLKPIELNTTNKLGVDANWVEAGLFAWLAYCTWHKNKLNLKYITGNNKQESILGCVYY